MAAKEQKSNQSRGGKASSIAGSTRTWRSHQGLLFFNGAGTNCTAGEGVERFCIPTATVRIMMFIIIFKGLWLRQNIQHSLMRQLMNLTHVTTKHCLSFLG